MRLSRRRIANYLLKLAICPVLNKNVKVNSAKPLRVCIDARLMSDGQVGGVEQFVIGLVAGLSGLADGREEYVFLCNDPGADRLTPYIGNRFEIIHGAAATRRPAWSRRFMKSRFVRNTTRKLFSQLLKSDRFPTALRVPTSDGTIEGKGIDLIHFPNQSAFLTEIPSVYHPWDLQHLHLPEFFSSEVIRKREIEYRAFCSQAKMVIAATSWQKRDLLKHYDLPAEKVKVIEPAAPTELYPAPSDEDLRAISPKFSLPERFVFYPAQTWPHKNHLTLLTALALLRGRENLSVPVVCSGKINDFYQDIAAHAARLNLERQVQFVGFVTPLELQCLYSLCTAMVFPTLFEGFGLPLMEAFSAGVPVACSNITSLAAQVDGAALLFDPHSASEIAEVMSRLWNDEKLRHNLAQRGRDRARLFSWNRTARVVRAVYRSLCNRELTDEDVTLLSEPPLT